jgi:hypothetical protein
MRNEQRTVIQELSTSDIPLELVINTRHPDHVPSAEETLELHCARLLLLMYHAGGRKAEITGRTKLAKMDFLVRYPVYLHRLAGTEPQANELKPDSPMVRYRYGPWDLKYYDVFALLVARNLVSILPTSKGDAFALTDRGRTAATELSGPEFDEIIERCRVVYKQVGSLTGTQVKKLIYDRFPEIVARAWGEEISS